MDVQRSFHDWSVKMMCWEVGTDTFTLVDGHVLTVTETTRFDKDDTITNVTCFTPTNLVTVSDMLDFNLQTHQLGNRPQNGDGYVKYTGIEDQDHHHYVYVAKYSYKTDSSGRTTLPRDMRPKDIEYCKALLLFVVD